jgi:hypothetical protein
LNSRLEEQGVNEIGERFRLRVALPRLVQRGTRRTLGAKVRRPFSQPELRVFRFEEVPLNRDIYLMGAKWMRRYESSLLALLNGKNYKNVGYISYAAARAVGAKSLELSWYPNVFDRFHEVAIRLPQEAFITCVECPSYDEKPRIFVRDEWLSRLHLRPYSAFALVDAIGVKAAISGGELPGEKLVALRNRIDELSAGTPSVAFVSFADSLLLKENWFVGQYNSETSYNYQPETLIRLVAKIAVAYRDILGMDVYATMTQGVNEYEDTSLLHTSPTGNHISLNSLGLPFAQLLAIDEAVRRAIRAGDHPPFQLYIDKQLFNSFQFRNGFEKRAQLHAPYAAPMSSGMGQYVCIDCGKILNNLDPKPPKPSRKKSSRKKK